MLYSLLTVDCEQFRSANEFCTTGEGEDDNDSDLWCMCNCFSVTVSSYKDS